MALPSIRDLLPDHLFNEPSTSLTLPPPPPASLPLSQPLFSHGIAVHPPTHDAHHVSSLPPGLSYSSQGSIPAQMPLMRPTRSLLREETINEDTLALDNAYAGRFIREDLPSDITRHDGSLFVKTYTSGNESRTLSANTPNGANGASQEIKKHSCPTCGKGFNRPSSLRIHANTHTGVKPYPCPFPGCGRLFSVSSNMRRHFRSHTKPNPPPPPVGAFSQNGSEARFRAWPSVNIAHATVSQPDTNPAILQPYANADTQRYGSSVHLLDDESKGERTSKTRQPGCTGTREANYEYPYPPYVPASGVNAYGFSSQATPPGLAYAQPRFSPAHPMVEDWTRISNQDYYHRPQGDHYQPVGIPVSHARLHAGHAPSALPSPSGEPHTRSTHYGVPPTPPYTNEAAFSPPGYASSLSPLRSSPEHSAGQLIVRSNDKTVVPSRETRQQRSPDTPDRLASELCDNPPAALPSWQEGPAESSFKQKLGMMVLEDRHVEVPARRHRSSLSLSELLHPAQEPHGLSSDSTASPAGPDIECPRNASDIPPTSALPLGTPSSSASTRAVPLESGQSDKPGSASETRKRKCASGATLGAVPSPPYPLLALPPPLCDENEGNLKSILPRRGGPGPSRPRKRRKRR